MTVLLGLLLFVSLHCTGGSRADGTHPSYSAAANSPEKLPSGHLMPIGYQNEIKRGEIVEMDMMISGSSFYREYWIPAKPIVFRGVLKHTQAMKRWINETYMREKFGSMRGTVDRRTRWERGGVEPPPRSVMNYSEFLNRLPKEQLYWDEEVPPDHPILNDMPVPLPLNCEATRALFQYVNLMINSGDVSYVLHTDKADNFFLFVAGEKRWLLANSSFRDSAYIGQGTQSDPLSPVNPDSVDLIKYPRMAEIEFHEILLHAGDVLYVPRDWPHYVRSSGTPNIAMNIWFGGEDAMAYLPNNLSCKRQLRTPMQLFNDRKL